MHLSPVSYFTAKGDMSSKRKQKRRVKNKCCTTNLNVLQSTPAIARNIQCYVGHLSSLR